MIILPIKKKWFDMILSGEKKEEYRDIKPYYDARFRNVWGYPAYWNKPQRVMFRNGYTKSSPAVIVDCRLSIKTGRVEWGAEPNKKYYVLTILDSLEVEKDEAIEDDYKYCPDCGAKMKEEA